MNEYVLIRSDNRIYAEFIKHATALAIYNFSRLFRRTRVKLEDNTPRASPENPCKSSLGSWRVREASKVIFGKDDLDIEGIESYLEYFEIEQMDCNESEMWTTRKLPNVYAKYIHAVKSRISTVDPEQQLQSLISHFTRLLVVVAHIANLEECLHLPVKMKPLLTNRLALRSLYSHDEGGRNWVNKVGMFFFVLCLFHDNEAQLCDNFMEHMTGNPRPLPKGIPWLQSDSGWSVFYDIVGDKDPSEVTPELVHVQRGVPTHVSSGERRKILLDGVYPPKSQNFPTIKGSSYLPKNNLRIHQRKEFWDRNAREFRLTVSIDVHVVHYEGARDIPSKAYPKFQALEAELMARAKFLGGYGYQEAHSALWEATLTPLDCCKHGFPGVRGTTDHAQLGPHAAVVAGYEAPYKIEDGVAVRLPHTVIILLTLGDPRLRWLALTASKNTGRDIIIRRPECCPNCALEHAANWHSQCHVIL